MIFDIRKSQNRPFEHFEFANSNCVNVVYVQQKIDYPNYMSLNRQLADENLFFESRKPTMIIFTKRVYKLPP